MKVKSGILALLLLAVFNLTAQEQPSFPYLTTSNGLIVATYHSENNAVEGVWPHIFAAIDSSHFVHPFAGNIRLKSEERPLETYYLQNTHVIECKYSAFTVDYLASFTSSKKILYAIVRGDKDNIAGAEFSWESGEGKPVTGMAHLANPFEGLPEHYAGKLFTGELLKQVSGKQWEKILLFSFTDALHQDTSVISREIERLRGQKGSLVTAETDFMQSVFKRCAIPKNLKPAEKNLMEQCISIFKMAQVGDNEVLPGARGQVLASLRPGLWHVAWVRDGSYAIQAMTRLGMYPEARKALEFMLYAKSGRFVHYRYTDGKDYGPGVQYRISLTRYFGNGTEECDYNEYGPNIEYDSWGLFLTAYSDYVLRSNDVSFALRWATEVEDEVAGAIQFVIDRNNMIRPDSGPWEHHLRNVKQYAFTSAVCARGLFLFAQLEDKLKRPSEMYVGSATRIRAGMYRNLLVNGKFFKSNAQETDPANPEFHDAGSLEMFANGLLENIPDLFQSNMEAYDKVLRTEAAIPAYIRMRSEDIYENQEWVFIDLRMAVAFKNYGQPEIAQRIVDRLTGYAALNHNQLPEMLTYINLWKQKPSEYAANEEWCYCIRDKNNQYAGAIPMVGYGAGAWVLAMLP